MLSKRTALFYRLLEKMLPRVLFKVFLHFLLKFKPVDEFFPFQNVIANLSLCVAACETFCCHATLFLGVVFSDFKEERCVT